MKRQDEQISKYSEKYWDIRNKTSSSADLYLYSVIGDGGEFWDETSAQDIIKAVQALGDISQLNIYINSPGGLVTEGMAIKAFLARQPFKKDVYIDGLCASIASAIAFGIGATVHMENTAYVMIHNAWAMACGDAAKLYKVAHELEKDNNNIRGIYLKRTAGKLSEDVISSMMSAETWMTAEECLEYGFIDEITDGGVKAAACMPKAYFDRYKHVPEGISVAEEETAKNTLESSDDAAKDIPISAETQAIIDKAEAVLKEHRHRKEYDNYDKEEQMAARFHA